MNLNDLIAVTKTEYTEEEMLFIIESYIVTKKGAKITLNSPRDPMRVSMMMTAFSTAMEYFQKEYNNGEKEQKEKESH